MSIRPTAPDDAMAARRLISVDDLSDADIAYILDLAEHYAGLSAPLRSGAANASPVKRR